MAFVAAGLVTAFFLASGILALVRGRSAWEAAFEFVAGAAIAIYVFHTSRRRLEADRTGLHFRSRAPWPLAAFDPDWSLAWSEIRAARWEAGHVPAQLVLDTPRGPRRIATLQWQADLQEARQCNRALAAYRQGRSTWFDPSLLPLVRALREHGVDVPQDIGVATRGKPGFDLARNPATRGTLLIAAVATAFWFIDASISDQMYGRREPWLVLGAFIAAAAGGFAVAQWRAGVPALANVVVTATVCVALGLAFYGGLQRLNQLADRQGPRNVEFTLERDGTLRSNVAEVRDLPPAFFGEAAYWAAQKPGSRHRFAYYHGLGFETLDIGEYRMRLKWFYGRDPGRGIVRP